MSTSRFGYEAIGTSGEVDTPAPLDAGIRQECRVFSLPLFVPNS